MDCKEFFQSTEGQGKEKCKSLWLKAEQELIAWESECASELSPGCVISSETVVRYWINPVHIDSDTGNLKPTAFADLSNKGLSVNRTSYTTLEEVKKAAEIRVCDYNINNLDKPQRQLVSFSSFFVGTLREMVSTKTGCRLLAVYDTAKEDDLSHADVCLISGAPEDSRSARAQLRELTMGRTTLF